MSRLLYLLACLPLAAALIALLRAWYPSLVRREAVPTRRERAVVALCVALGVVAVYGAFLAGDALFAYRDEGLDTVDLYVPFYLDLLDSLRDGTFGAWNFDYGLGASVVSYQSWLLDPFNLLVVPLGLLAGDANLGIVLAVAQAAKMLLAGLLFDSLAARFCETPLARVVGSLCYALCGFTVLWGQHYWLGALCPLFALELVALERLAEKGGALRFLSVAAVTAVCVGWSPYCGFMVLVCAAAYMLLRLIHLAPAERPARFVAARTGRLAAPVACGCLLACATLVPYALYLFGETARVSGSDASLASRALSYASEFVPLDWVPAILSRLLGDGLVTSGGAFPEGLVSATASFPYVNCYEFVSLGFGALSIVLLLQFAHWACTEASRRDRALICAAALLVVLYLANSFLPALLNIFSAPKYRSSFALAVPVCLAMAVAWERRVQCGRVARVPLIAGAAASLAVIGWSAAHTVDGAALCGLYLLCVAAGTVLLALSRPPRPARGVVMGLCAVLAAGLLGDAWFVTSNRRFCTREDFPAAGSEHVADTEAALAWIGEQDDSLFRVEKTYVDWGLFNDALVQGYHGVSCYNSTCDGDVVEYYRLLWPSAVGGDGASQGYMDAEKPLALTGELGVRYLLSRERQTEPFELVATFGDVNVYRDGSARGLLTGRAGAVGEAQVRAAGSEERRRELLDESVCVPDEVLGESAAGGDGTETIEAALSLEGGQVVTGSFDASEDSYACLLVPYSSGWTVLVDGERVQTFRANLGFVGFEVEAGSHRIEARYEIPGLAAGAGVSLAGLAATGLGAAWSASSRRRSDTATSSRTSGRA